MKKIPINGTFELTPRCNMDCKMCYIKMTEEEIRQHGGRERSAKEWIEMGRICREQGMLFLLLSGGEPFVRKDFKEIYGALSRMGFVISINTNGTLIDEGTVEWLKQTPPSKINITLYGSSNETYAGLCGNRRGFGQTVRAIDMLQNAGICVGIHASFTKYNRNDMDAIYDFAAKRKIPVRAVSYMFPPVRRTEEMLNDDVRMSPQEAGRALFLSKKCEMTAAEFSGFVDKISDGYSEEESEECGRVADEHMGCVAGRSSFFITWDGKMTPCGMMNQPFALPFEEGFEDSWDKICRETEKIFLPAECKSCKKRFACKICGALAIAEGEGDATKKPEYLCKMTESFLNCCIKEKVRS